jgi:formylglycine-generating enzyme required for sulfatase activity
VGNVFEVVLDQYVAYDANQQLAACAGSACVKIPPSSGAFNAVIKGGSFADDSDQARSAHRSSTAAAARADSVGFRCARDR